MIDTYYKDLAIPEVETKRWQLAVSAGVFGWLLDAFDFFILIFLFDLIAAHFHVRKEAVVYTLTLTLAMRPLGALFFGALADRYGRKWPLIGCVLYFSAVTVLSGLAPSFTFFVIMRALYGLGMGGFWGIGASYAMESAPPRMRGLLSGMMQGGYPMGYLCAAVAIQVVTLQHGWRVFFFLGAPVALLVALLTYLAPESGAWGAQKLSSVREIFHAMLPHGRIFIYLLILMSVMLCLSHGTQDLYPDFLKSTHRMSSKRIAGMNALYAVPILYNIAAIGGALLFGSLSEWMGRRYSIMLSLVLCLISIPAWAFGNTVLVLVLGSCLMQLRGQGAFGVIPAHINELCPASLRGLFPGFVYQLGVLVASPATILELKLRDLFGYQLALAGFATCVVAVLLVLFYFGPEARGKSFLQDTSRTSEVYVD
ncbi:MFS transporter [Granulicella sp. dw_53]|uniref:MFS transporter n=1 Tax=Granulicella sp. dw_53 TaxID=2719792 RepID=UPI002105AF79|nr:MFS transporter [Granulicella sp. dw_53]